MENNNYENLYKPETPVSEQFTPPPAMPVPEVPPKPEIKYSNIERISAFLCMILGFLFIRFVFYHETGLFTTIFYWLFTTLEVIFVKKSDNQFSKGSKFMIAVLYLFSCVFTITANVLLKNLTVIFLILVSGLFLLGINSNLNNVLKFLPESIPLIGIAMPFAESNKCFGAINSSHKSKGLWKNLGYILGGLAIALPLTALVATLLCQSDENMSALLGKFLKIPPENMLLLAFHALLGIPVGFLIFSSFYSSTHHSVILNSETCEQKAIARRFIPNMILYTAVTPICILYILYIISQINYFMGGFMGILAEGYTYAEYARKGFFELCIVCCINFLVITSIHTYAKITDSETSKKPLALKIYSIYLCFCSLFLSSTAIAKMILYIQYYGMTRLRIYTTWFMILLVIGFVLIIIQQFIKKLNAGKIAFITFTIMFGLLCFSKPDAFITRYNANQYLSGNLENFDNSMLRDLSLDAWGALSYYTSEELEKLSINLTKRKEILQDDFYQELNLSAWEILYHVK